MRDGNAPCGKRCHKHDVRSPGIAAPVIECTFASHGGRIPAMAEDDTQATREDDETGKAGGDRYAWLRQRTCRYLREQDGDHPRCGADLLCPSPLPPPICVSPIQMANNDNEAPNGPMTEPLQVLNDLAYWLAGGRARSGKDDPTEDLAHLDADSRFPPIVGSHRTRWMVHCLPDGPHGPPQIPARSFRF